MGRGPLLLRTEFKEVEVLADFQRGDWVAHVEKLEPFTVRVAKVVSTDRTGKVAIQKGFLLQKGQEPREPRGTKTVQAYELFPLATYADETRMLEGTLGWTAAQIPRLMQLCNGRRNYLLSKVKQPDGTPFALQAQTPQYPADMPAVSPTKGGRATGIICR